MSKNLTVAALKLGDKFEFLTQNGPESKSSVMIVTRNPSVNLAANSCHFRYQPDVPPAADGVRKWDENNSWNGTPDVPVRLIEAAPKVEPVAKVEVAPKVAAVKVEAPPPKVEVAKAEVVKVAVVAEDEPEADDESPMSVKKKPVKKLSIKKTVVEKAAVKKAPRRRRAL